MQVRRKRKAWGWRDPDKVSRPFFSASIRHLSRDEGERQLQLYEQAWIARNPAGLLEAMNIVAGGVGRLPSWCKKAVADLLLDVHLQRDLAKLRRQHLRDLIDIVRFDIVEERLW